MIAETVNETTTHVICGDSRRTLNVLQCVARGAWLLNKSWVSSLYTVGGPRHLLLLFFFLFDRHIRTAKTEIRLHLGSLIKAIAVNTEIHWIL